MTEYEWIVRGGLLEPAEGESYALFGSARFGSSRGWMAGVEHRARVAPGGLRACPAGAAGGRARAERATPGGRPERRAGGAAGQFHRSVERIERVGSGPRRGGGHAGS